MRRFLTVLSVCALAACGSDNDPVGPDPRAPAAPQNLNAEYEWIFLGWLDQEPIGEPAVQVTWDLPAGWNGEPFRVYGKPSDQSEYELLATVTSCADERCRYTDLNVRPGEEYAFYVTAVNERTGVETSSPDAVAVEIPPVTRPPRPQAPGVIALDGALFLNWPSVGAQLYIVYLEDAGELFEIGQTDGTGYLDTRAENGVLYEYRIAAVDETGPYSELSPLGSGVPRPDSAAVLVYAFGDRPAESGFQFGEGANRVVSGSDASAQWRMEIIDGQWFIRPLGETVVTQGQFTTTLTCGPASDPDCVAVTEAPASGYGSEPVEALPEFTYVLQLQGADGQTRFAKVRVETLGLDAAGNRLMIFDWAFQPRPDERSLNRSPR